jgi:hypothetical protein
MRYGRPLIEAIKHEISVLESQSRVAAAMRDGSGDDAERALQEAARRELSEKADLLRRSLGSMRTRRSAH